MLSIATDGGDYIGTTSTDIVIQDGEDIGYIEVYYQSNNYKFLEFHTEIDTYA